MKKAAVIQAVYYKDNAEWLEQSVKSILGQKCNPWQINYYICIDGPVCQQVRGVLDKFRVGFHTILENETNLGLAKSLNRLIGLLEDEKYVFRMDSDDISLPYRLKKQLDFMENNSEIGICGSSLIEIDKDGKQQTLRSYYEKNENIVENMYKGTAVGHPTVCFRRHALEKLQGYNETLRVSQDIDLWFRAILSDIQFYNIQEPLLLYRKADNFYSRRSIQKAFKEFVIYWDGCNKLYGIGIRNLFPFMRLLFRLMPLKITAFIYSSSFRKILYKKSEMSKHIHYSKKK